VLVVGDAATDTQDGHPGPGVAWASQFEPGGFVGMSCQPCQRTQGWPDRSGTRNKANMAVGKNFAISSRPFAQQRFGTGGVAAYTCLRCRQLSEPVPRPDAMGFWSICRRQRRLHD